MSPNYTDQFIDDLYQLKDIELTDHVVCQAKRCLLDYLGATFAGAAMLEKKGEAVLRLFGDLPDSGSAVIGFGRRIDVQNAAFVNGLSAHVAELDDGVISGIIHPGSPILSALLPIAEREKVTGAKLLLGIVLGYEASVRVADAMQPSHKKRGYHGTGTFGAIGAAVGIAVMLDFSKAQAKRALSAAAVSAGGSLKVLEGGSELKPFNVARAAQAGIVSAIMAQAGFEGPDDVFSGKAGLFSVMADESDVSCLSGRDDGLLAIERVYVKPHAACRYCHPAIDAALKIRKAHSLRTEDIKVIEVATYLWAVANHDHTVISGSSSARMSIPYSVSVALLRGNADIEVFSDENIQDVEISSLTKKIQVYSSDELTALFPTKCAATVEVIMHDGQVFRERVDDPKGDPDCPLTNDEMVAKFSALADFAGRSCEGSDEVVRIVWNLEEDLQGLYQFM
jgi:2-methylcitrate dehydratase PrpD